jgi:signal transduction histidine kinase/CheY-like chemotaxis protein
MSTATPTPGASPAVPGTNPDGQKGRWFWVFAIVCAILAGAVAFTTVLAARHSREALLDEEQAADAWNFYQAKVIKANILASKMDLLATLGTALIPADEEKARQYELERQRLYKDAKMLEASAVEHRNTNRLYVGFVGFFQVCMAIAVIAVLLQRMLLLDRTRRGLDHAIEERRDLERKFVQAQKLEAVGRLAAGVAHDFNNLLTVINGYSERIADGRTTDAAMEEPARQIREAGLRGAALTRQLLSFAHRLPLSLNPVNLNAVVESMCIMLRRLIGADIRLVTDLDPGLGTMIADEGQISQVLMNLSVNARDAMKTGGVLTISTRNSAAPPDHVADAPPSAHGWVCMQVTDTGTGMTEEVLGKVFEPFFTTKEVGKGTGLGMSTCLQIVREHHGVIDIESNPGKGTTVRVYLPASNVQSETPQPQAGERITPTGTETILLAEDEPAVRELGAILLRELGYNVIEAADGVEALAQFYVPDRPRPSLVISDLVMPTMGGFELARKVFERDPSLPFLFTSGYSGEQATLDAAIPNLRAFLQKPYSPHELGVTVRRMLDGARQKPATP